MLFNLFISCVCLFFMQDPQLWPRTPFLFVPVNFAIPGSSPADPLRHGVLFLHYFCTSWLGNWIMNKILAEIFNGLTPMVLSCCLARFYKGTCKSFLLTKWDLSRVWCSQLMNLFICLRKCVTSMYGKPFVSVTLTSFVLYYDWQKRLKWMKRFTTFGVPHWICSYLGVIGFLKPGITWQVWNNTFNG